jgi:hypothetical protein
VFERSARCGVVILYILHNNMLMAHKNLEFLAQMSQVYIAERLHPSTNIEQKVDAACIGTFSPILVIMRDDTQSPTRSTQRTNSFFAYSQNWADNARYTHKLDWILFGTSMFKACKINCIFSLRD